MRILFTFIGGSGHFRPLIPVARAVEAAGHIVAVAGSGNVTSEVRAAGFQAFATSEPRTGPQEPVPPLEPLDPELEDRVLRDGFARSGARRHAAAILGIARTWRPDVVVRDEVDFGSAIAAEVLGLPIATVLVLAAGSFLRKELVAEPMAELRSEHGLAPDPDLAMLDGDLVLSPFPPSFRSPAYPLPANAFSFRPGNAIPRQAASNPPTVYFTFGTVPYDPGVFLRVLGGLASLPVKVVATVGAHADPASFGPQPDHVRLERFVPQELLLPRCDLVVSHAGSGSVIGALEHGLPSILLPMGADQAHNTQRCLELRTALELDPVSVSPSQVARSVMAVLETPAYRRNAERIQDEMNALPGVEHTMPLLEGLVRPG